MRTRFLQFRKAMSAALFVLLLSVVGMKNAFAQTQVATLQHDGEITNVYYGQNAFASASSAAVSGDVITLSSGTFNSGGSFYYSGITIHGAGCMYDTLTATMPTIITGDVNLRNNDLSFEGVWFTGTIISNNEQLSATAGYSTNNVSFVKCNINAITTAYDYNRRNNWQLMDCIISDFGMSTFHGMSIINSVVRFTAYTHNDNYNCTSIYNSIIIFDNGLNIKNINAYNSIISTASEHNVSNCTFDNCIGIKTGETSLFEGQIVQNVMEVNSYQDVFENFTGEISNSNNYQLKETIATTFLGNDGTEVGIYGGMMPYDPRPSYMRMKRCNVAPRSTVDGKLSVDIEILTDDE